MPASHLSPRSWCLVLAAGFAFLLAGSASAVAPSEESAALERWLPEFDPCGISPAGTDALVALTERSMAEKHGGRWHVYGWNAATQGPRSLYGTGFETGASAAAPDELEHAATSLLREHADLLRLSADEMSVTDLRVGFGKAVVHFEQRIAGVPVLGGRAHLSFTDAGRLFEMGAVSYRGQTGSAHPAITAAQAEARATNDLPFVPGRDAVEEGTTLYWLPIFQSATSYELTLVWRVRVRTEEPIGIWITDLDARTGQILSRVNDVRFLDVSGDVDADVRPVTTCNAPISNATRYQRIDVVAAGSDTTDALGNWSLPALGTAPRTLTCRFLGPYVNVQNQLGPNSSISTSVTPGVPLHLQWTDANAQKDERDVFDAVSDLRDFFLPIAPDLSLINGMIQANVSINNSCNAFWSGSINFYRASAGCNNTGEIKDVVYHEYGHAVQFVVVGQQGDHGLGEGNSDVLASIMSQESTRARGFYVSGCNAGLRYAKNQLRYPENVIGQEAHSAGRVILGFQWDAMERLQAIYGPEEGTRMAAERWHWGRWLEKPTLQPDQVLSMFIADDDDGNLDNGTPNYDTYCLAGQNHGFTCPPITQGVEISHDALASRTTPGDAEVTASILSFSAALDPASVRVFRRLNGGAFEPVAMTATGNPDEYQAILADLARPTEVEYYLEASDVEGRTTRFPREAPLVVLAFDVADAVYDMEAADGWSVNQELGDSATGGVWERLDPVYTAAQPEFDHSPDAGTITWVTGNGTPGGVPAENDVDGGVTTLYSPVLHLTGVTSAVFKYWRWYSNNAGQGADTDPWVVQARLGNGPWVDVERTYEASNAWLQVRVDLRPLLGGGPLGDVRLRFRASDLDAPSIVEALVDDATLLTTSSPAGVFDGVPRQLSLRDPSPNPSSRGANLEFDLPTAGDASLSIYDVSGRLVRTLADGQLPPGRHTAAWDGRDAAGRLAGAGVYFARLEYAGARRSCRVVIGR